MTASQRRPEPSGRGIVLGFDLGTSFLKVAAVDPGGRVIGLSATPVPVESPSPGFHEVPVSAFRRMLASGVREAIADAGATVSSIVAVSYSSQANSFLLLDSNLQPLTPIVLWNDERAAQSGLSASVAGHFEDPDFLLTTGLGISSPLFCLAKLAWFRRYRPETWRKTRYVMTISDYFAFELTGRRVGDWSTASLLGMWDVRGERYRQNALETVGLEDAMLSYLLRPGSPVGPCDGPGARMLGIPNDAKFAVGSLDHVAAARGAGVGGVADASESSGTVLAAVTFSEAFEPLPGASVGPGAVPGEFYTLGFEDVGASALSAFCRRRGRTIDEVSTEAADAPPGCGGVICIPEAVGDEPESGFYRADGRIADGVAFRAILEALSARLARLLVYAGHGSMPSSVVSTGGGAQNDLWMAMKAAVCGVPFVRSREVEPGARGAAMYAAVAAGWFESHGECSVRFAEGTDSGERFEPSVPMYRDWPESYARAVGELVEDCDGGS